MLGDDPRSGQPHEERDEEEAEEHDEDQQELALVHRVQPETNEDSLFKIDGFYNFLWEYCLITPI
jgi:hypothetical protein